jgi:hypothetical protein
MVGSEIPVVEVLSPRGLMSVTPVKFKLACNTLAAFVTIRPVAFRSTEALATANTLWDMSLKVVNDSAEFRVLEIEDTKVAVAAVKTAALSIA